MKLCTTVYRALLTFGSSLFVVGASARAQQSAARPPLPGAPVGVTAFVDVSVVPMDTERVVPGQTVLVQHGWIIALGATGRVQVPADAVRIDGRGKFLIPGLGDCHAHIGYNGNFRDPLLDGDSAAASRLFRWLVDGVTTIRNLDYMDRDQSKRFRPFLLKGTDLLRLRSRAAAGELWSPRIYTAGQWGPGHYTNYDVTLGWMKGLPSPNLDSVAVYVAAYKAAGYNFIKIHEETPAVFAAVLAAARQVGIPVVGHVPQGALLEQALVGGMQSIEHMTGYPSDTSSVSDSQAQALARATRDAGTWNCVTMMAGGKLSGKLVNALHNAGAGLLLGSDYPFSGAQGVHEELKLLVQQAGLTPYEALATGTKHFGAYLRTLDPRGGEIGTIAVGKRADLVLLEGNPLQAITHVKRRAGVMLGGRWLGRDELEQRLFALESPRSWLLQEYLRADIRPSTNEQLRQMSEQMGKLYDLSDSLGAAPSKSAEYERLVRRLAAEFGTMRALLAPAQHAAFDPIARVWWRVQARQGYQVTIPGVAAVLGVGN